MSIQTPPTLQELAVRSLLRNEAMAMSYLGELPAVLFPEVFKEAFARRHINIVKEMVAVWPFPRLAVGALMETPNLEIYKALLDGVDMGLKEEFQHREKNLKVLDLRNVHHTFWNICADERKSGCSSETLNKKQVVKVFPRYALRQRLRVIVDLCLKLSLNKTQAYFLNWVQQRKSSLHFCCIKMTIWSIPFQDIKGILNVFDREHIAELELHTKWTLLQLRHFAHYFGQMRNLRKLILAPLHMTTFSTIERTRVRETRSVNNFISQFSQFNCLQHLFISQVHFLRVQMHQILGFLMTRLETLSITNYITSQRDLNSLSCCESLFQLKHLDLRGTVLYSLDLMPLRALLHKVEDTLEILQLEGCRMIDSQLNALLPALRQCSQLTKINLYKNDFSMHILMALLQHTDNWNKIVVEQYPAPLECYELSHVSRERFSQLCSQLMATLRAIRQPKNIAFASKMCQRCAKHCVYTQVTRLCRCWH